MIRQNLLILIAIIALPSCYQCHKTDYYYEQTTTKKYLPHYNNGSYFVFQNTADSTDIDTFYVRNYIDSMAFHFIKKKCDGNYFETIKFSLISSVHNDSFGIVISAGSNFDNFYLKGNCRNLTYAVSFYVPNGSYMLFSSGHYTDTVISLLNYTVAGTIYNDVMEVKQGFLFPKNSPPIMSCFAAHIGLIQLSTFDLGNNVFGNTYLLRNYSL